MPVTLESSQAEIGAYLQDEIAKLESGAVPTRVAMDEYLTLASRLPAIRSFDIGPNYPKILLALQELSERMHTVLMPSASGVNAERSDAA